jgi:hypothetical protein
LCILRVPCEVESLSDYFHQLRAVNAINSGRKHGRGHVYASDGISRRFPRIYSHWAPAYAFRRLLLVDLVPAFALTSYVASLSRSIFELTMWWANHVNFLALSFSSIADARNAIGRLQECFTAELISDMFEQDPDLKHALEVEGASFTWDSPPPDESKEQKGKKNGRRTSSKAEPASEPREVKEENLFKLKEIDFKVPRGQLLAIVGAVGSGKTSLLQGLIGDMRKTSGSVRFGGSLAYCSQSAWIQVSFPLKIIEIQWVKSLYRMPLFGTTFASVGPSSLSVIGKLCTTLAWRMTLMYFQTAI